MMWKDSLFKELDRCRLFHDSAHKSRFHELVDCYAKAPFFTPGLCKCMYLSSWDDEHFAVMLDMLNQLSFMKNMNLDDMNENGELMAEESGNHYDAYILRLSCCFLMDQPFDVFSLPEDLDPQGMLLIRQALKAADIIDTIYETEPPL